MNSGAKKSTVFENSDVSVQAKPKLNNGSLGTQNSALHKHCFSVNSQTTFNQKGIALGY